jgi:cell division protein FtsN
VQVTAQTGLTKQLGNTVIGIIIGLVVGLGLALGVAVYVTKVPVPFVNKGQTRSADQDAAEAKKNKGWDPNAPMYGKQLVKPAPAASAAVGAESTKDAGKELGKETPKEPAKDIAKSEPAKTDPPKTEGKTAIATVPVPKPEAKPDPKPAVTADPIGDLAKAKSSASGVDPFTYFIQVGAYRTVEDAESWRAKLSLSGIEAKVTEREQSGRPIFRVRVGPFDKKDEADKAKERMAAAGLDTALVRVQR